MDYEKAYKEALERAKHYTKYSTNRSDTAEPIKNAVEMIFPELKESEDEKIRKDIIAFIERNKRPIAPVPSDDTLDRWIAWLEKQREQKSIEQDTETQDLWVYIREWNDKFGRLPKDEDELAACIDYVMRRQKPADKVEPKFKVGDWIVSNTNPNCVNSIMLIADYNNDSHSYLCRYCDGQMEYSYEFIENSYHLWTIQDAKDGDVLVVNNKVFIYAHRKQLYSIAVAHCFVDSAGGFYFDGEFGYMENGNLISLATKEQRDTLFAKMKEAGYEWDDEKKGLKKIEQKPADSYCQENCKGFQESGKCFSDWDCKAKREAKQKPAWSDEDEKKIMWLVRLISTAGFRELDNDKMPCSRSELLDWLKSLKPNHWKPSEEQLRVLQTAIKDYGICHEKYVLESLYNSLKKL